MRDRPAPADHVGGVEYRVRHKYPKLASYGLELALAGLLLLTFAAIYFQNAILQHSVVLSPRDHALYTVAAHGDEANKGSSTIHSEPERWLEWSCELKRDYAYPYCGYELLFDSTRSQKGLDLRHVETVSLDLDYRGMGKSLRVYLKNFDSRYSRTGASETSKYNQVEVAVRPGRQRVDLRLPEFSVAQWWLIDNSIPPELSRPEFGNVVAIEIETGTGAPLGRHAFRIDTIALHSRWFTHAEWYLAILGSWVALILAFLTHRVVRLSLDLRERRAQQALALSQVEAVRRQAQTDYLTQVSNRAGLADLYPRLISRPDTTSVAVLLADVDHFKVVNDRFGHECGDRVLRSISRLLREQTGEDDLVARWGGEEFVVVLHNRTEADAIKVAAKLRRAIEDLPLEPCDGVTVSLGACWSSDHLDNLGAMIDRADAALYAAKRQGRNCVVMQGKSLCEPA